MGKCMYSTWFLVFVPQERGSWSLMHIFSCVASVYLRLQVSTGKGFSKTLPLIFSLLGAIPCKFPRYPKGEMRAVPLWDVNPVW